MPRRSSTGPRGVTVVCLLAGACPLALACTGTIGSNDPGQRPAPGGDGSDPGITLRRLSPVDAAAGGGPRIGAVRFPAAPAGDIPMDVTIEGATGGPLELRVEISRDGGATFRAASLRGLAGGVATVAAPGPARPLWLSLADVGFRQQGGLVLRLIAADPAGPGPAALFAVPPLDNLRAAARRVDHYLINYGAWSADSVALAKRHQLVVTGSGHGQLTRAAVADLQAGVDARDPGDDVLVLCYLSIGEDLRTAPLSMDQIRADARFRGDGTGPRVDPRGPSADGASLRGIDPRGAPSNGGGGFASFYLDDLSVHDSPLHQGDGIPDRNAAYGALFVNAGDPRWFDVVDAMSLDGVDGVPGLRELLTADYARGLDCDGLFLDTIDTASPNSYTDAASGNETKFEWTAPGLSAFIRRVHAAYPDKLLLQNRGLFYFMPSHAHYEWNARGAIDFVLFESYRLNSSATEQWNPGFYADNQYNVAPKLMAEANRPDGFKVLSLGYAAGPADQISTATLTGQATLGYDSLMEDIRVTQDLAGFRHYLADPALALVNDFVLGHADMADRDAPRWSSTDSDNGTEMPPTPRVGIQRATAAAGLVTVAWDVAMDKNRVHYVLYAQPQPFDFQADPGLGRASRIPLAPVVPADYAAGSGPGRFPHQATLSGFPARTTQYLVIRAADESPAANEDGNTVVLTATP